MSSMPLSSWTWEWECEWERERVMMKSKGRRRFQMRIWRGYLFSTCQKCGWDHLLEIRSYKTAFAFLYQEGSRVSTGFTWVDRVLDWPAGSTEFLRANSQMGFYLNPDRFQAPDRLDPGSTRRAGPGFKTMLSFIKKSCFESVFLSNILLTWLVFIINYLGNIPFKL